MRRKKEIEEFEEERRGRRRSLAWGFILALMTMGIGAFFGARCARGQGLNYEQFALSSAIFTGADVAPSYVAEEEEPAWSLNAELGFWNQYLSSNGGVYHDRPVAQLELILVSTSGFYVGAWASRTEGPYRETWGDEADGFIGYEPNDFFDVGLLYILSPRTEESDWGMAYVKLTTPPLTQGSWSLSAHLGVDYLWPFKTHSDMEKGYNFRVGGELSQEGERWSAKQVAEVIYDTGAFGAGEGYLWVASVEVARTAGASTIGVGAKYSRGINLPEWDDRLGEFALGTFIRF